MTFATLFPETKLYIDGVLRPASGGATYPDISPWDGTEIGRAADASRDDLEEAIAAARHAFDETDWSTNLAKRLDHLRRFVAAIRADRERIAALVKHEVGGAAAEIPMSQCDKPLSLLDFFLQTAEEYPWEEDLGVAETFGVMSRRVIWKEPIGVIAAITPWNVPAQINLVKVIPALAAGCTVVLKPAPETPMIAAILGEVAEATGLPKGVLNIVTSSSASELGEMLVMDPRVDLISFTGSTATGKRIMANAADRIARVFLELGGKSANIVLDDADFPSVIPKATSLTFHAGQGCAHLTRLLVPRSRYEEAVDILKQAYEAVQYGDPDDPRQGMGPLISERQRQRILDYIEIGKQEGARLVTGGGVPPHLPAGYFVEPTVFADVTNDMRIAREEIFGPVLVVIAFDDDEDAIRIANDSPFGLSGAVHSGSLERATHVARKVRTGTFSVNGGMWLGAESPFGGYKQSGLGREMGVAGFEEYLETKVVGFRQ